MFGIECQRSEENVQFYFDDPEAARYVWKLAVLQVRNSLFFLLPEIRGRIRKFPIFGEDRIFTYGNSFSSISS